MIDIAFGFITRRLSKTASRSIALSFITVVALGGKDFGFYDWCSKKS